VRAAEIAPEDKIMADKFLMPKLSPTMEEGQIARWLKAEGETFEANETIAEVDTDKATMELTALKAGTLLKILKQGGETALLNEAIAITGNAGEDFSALLAELGTTAAAPAKAPVPTAEKVEEAKPAEPTKAQPATVAVETGGRLLVSPIAARMATENGVDLRAVTGSGPGGRIIKRDIESILDGGSAASTATQAVTAARSNVWCSRIP
jgi:pyruvate dehydrogenase E2 component (dihydrolipoamide acetyltransferase)